MAYPWVSLASAASSEAKASVFATLLNAPLILTFSGEIGAGKTTFIRAMLRALGVKSLIKSPTFALVESYKTRDFMVHHFDLYRIQEEAELDYIGFRDYFSEQAVCCIEWPERAPLYLEKVDIQFKFSILDFGRRMFAEAQSAKGVAVLDRFMGEQ